MRTFLMNKGNSPQEFSFTDLSKSLLVFILHKENDKVCFKKASGWLSKVKISMLSLLPVSFVMLIMSVKPNIFYEIQITPTSQDC